MQQCVDQMGREVLVPTHPKRIISLVPSLSELLCYLGYKDRLVGVTDYCIYPKSLLAEKRSIGGTKKFNIEQIQELQPDLIIGDKEENYQEGIHVLEESYPVWMCDFNSIAGSLEMIVKLGDVLSCQHPARKLVDDINGMLTGLQRASPIRVAYFIWRKPFMVAASNTYINDVLESLGFTNAFSDVERYPAVDEGQIQAANPDVIFLSSEPFPFKEKHIEELSNLCPNAYVILVDGASFSWSGPRLLEAEDYFSALVAHVDR